ncbi:MAG: hypothetical protein K2M05_05340 [Paramuribaculum sp.]|nr:hypothetical protein [Paramuribaculum sp.]MDE6304613.1 hypothetical protein [Paramuribaculum sp.]
MSASQSKSAAFTIGTLLMLSVFLAGLSKHDTPDRQTSTKVVSAATVSVQNQTIQSAEPLTSSDCMILAGAR